MLVDAAAGMLQMCPAPGTGTPGFGMGGHRRAAGGAAHSAGQPGVPLHPKCPSRVAPVKETREPGSALKKQPKLLFHLRPASARAARSLEPVLSRGGSAGDGAPPAPPYSQHRLLLHQAKRRGAAAAPGSRQEATRFTRHLWGGRRQMGTCGCWRSCGCPPGCPCCTKPSLMPPVLAQHQGGVLGTRREPMAGPMMPVACGISRGGSVLRVAPGTTRSWELRAGG